MASNATKSGDDGEYKVGPGKPPIEHQFQPGNKLGGRKKGDGSSLTARIKAALDKEEDGGKTVAEALVDVGVKAAMKGDATGFKYWLEILNRIDGKVADRLLADVRASAKALPDEILKDVQNASAD